MAHLNGAHPVLMVSLKKKEPTNNPNKKQGRIKSLGGREPKKIWGPIPKKTVFKNECKKHKITFLFE